MQTKLIHTKDYLLLIDEEAKINETGTLIYEHDTNLINVTGVDYEPQGLDSKIIAYYPLTKEAKGLDLPLLPNPFEEVNIEDLSEKANGYAYYGKPLGEKYLAFKEGFIEGYKAAQSKRFSLEDIEKAIKMATWINPNNPDRFYSKEEIIQSLSTQQLPKEFTPEYKDEYISNGKIVKSLPISSLRELKTITNSEGKKELIGTYKY